MKCFNFFARIIITVFLVISCFVNPKPQKVQAEHNTGGRIRNIDEALKYYQQKFPPSVKYASPNSKDDIMMEKKVIDDDLKYLTFFKELKKLYVIDSKQVTDNGLEYIKDLESIEFLFLWGTNVSIKGLRKLSKLKNLIYLSLDDTNIIDDDLQIIADLFPKLEMLSLNNNKIKGTGIQYLRKLPLAELYLEKTIISDETVKYFAGFKNCEIYLLNTKVTKKGKEEILRITKDCLVSIKEGDLAPLKE